MVGNISVRFSVQDAEVVRAALEKLGKDGEAALRRIDAAGQGPSAGLKAFSNVASELQGRAAGLTSSLGLTGTALLAFGPIGIAVGAAIGLVYTSFISAGDAVQHFAEKARSLHDLSASTGLATEQLQGLLYQAKKLGLDGEHVGNALQKFTVQMDELRKGTGSARAQLLAINPALLNNLENSKSTAQAVDILARAYHGLGIEQQNALSRAFFGRGGIDLSRLMSEISGGGIDGLLQKARESGKVFDVELLERFRRLSIQAEESGKHVNNLKAKLYGEEWYKSTIAMNDAWATFYGWLLKIDNQKLDNVVNILKVSAFVFGGGGMARGAQGQRQTTNPVEQSLKEMQNAREALKAGLQHEKGFDASSVWYPKGFKDEDNDKDTHFWEREANKFREFTSVLGAAATPAEQLKLKMFELMATVEKNGTVTGAAKRALDEFKFSQQQAAVAARERMGIASQDEILTIRMTELERERAKGYIRSAQEMATAAKQRGKEARDAFEHLQIKTSDLPGLKQLEIDAGRLDKTLDKFGTETANAVSNSLVDIASGTKSASDGFKDMGNSVVRSLSQMLIQMTIVKPLAQSLMSTLGAFLPGAPLALGTPGGSGGGLGGSYANGGAFLGGNIVPFASGGIVGRPTLFPMAGGMGLMGERGPEAVMPLQRLPSGRLGVDASGGGGVHRTVINNFSSASVEPAGSKANESGGIDDIFNLVDKRVSQTLGSGRADNIMKARYGLTPARQRR